MRLDDLSVRDAMQDVRSPMPYLREEVEAGRSLAEEQRIYKERMQRLEEKWSELCTLALEAKVIWGGDAESCFDGLRELIATLGADIWLHFWLKGAYAGPSAQVDSSPDRVAANDRVVYRTSDHDDFSQRTNVAVGKVEDFYRKRLRG